ncbi:hypothetical protein GCM10009775_08550 [Microbacterium aoyamense]|uniref:DUF1697 domain-containing protein n=1 Tax=Microbacterium aoyamense TaxID=344166 RepID=A0ABN2PDD9_9MICO|nr:DUF1697 domain-containing protein [Microbacterium aoyamense]
MPGHGSAAGDTMGYVQHVALFRNVNQGQRGHPSADQIVAAFRAAGAVDAVTFQSNGTVVFTARDAAAAAVAVRHRLGDDGVFDDLIEVRPLSFLELIVAEHAGAPDAHRRELTLFDEAVRLGDASIAHREATKRRCSVVADGAGWAVVLNDRDRQSNGTPAVQAIIGAPATSRGLPTLARLIDRFAAR